MLKHYREQTFAPIEQVERDRRHRLVDTIRGVLEIPNYPNWLSSGIPKADRFGPSDVEDFVRSNFQLLTKLKARDLSERLRSAGLPTCSKYFTTHTSGTTGTGLVFPVTWRAHQEQFAVWWRFREWHGIKIGTPCLYFGGRPIVPAEQRNPPYWRFDSSRKQLIFSSYHLSKETARSYLTAVSDSGFEWIHGYPSTVSLLAGYAKELGIYIPMRWVSLGAETVMPHQERLISEAFGVQPIEHYGLAEGVANISMCPERRLHVDEDFSYVEFLPSQNGKMRIVGTSLHNGVFPLVRYDTGDLANLGDGDCICGRPGRVVSTIDGRKESFVVTKSGMHLGRLDHIFKDMTNVIEAQILQDSVGAIVLKIVRGEAYSTMNEKQLIQEFAKRVGEEELSIEFDYVDRIEKTAAGKLRFVISRI